jgi:hypothetical protein
MSLSPAQARIGFAVIALAAWLASVPDAMPQSSNLVVNPLLSREMPVPGWIGDHRDTWVQQHPVYASACQTAEVTKEVRFLNRVIAYDEYLLSLTNSSDQGNPAAAKLADIARRTMDNLRRDIVVADALAAQLKLLPNCAQTPEAPARPAPLPARAIQSTSTTPPPAAASDDKPAGQRTAPSAPAPPSPEAGAPTPPPDPAALDRFVIRFDGRVAALTPSGIRAFDEAVNALRGGRKVQLAIEGCEPGADFSNGSACARRLLSLKAMLADNGIRNVKPLLEEPR